MSKYINAERLNTEWQTLKPFGVTDTMIENLKWIVDRQPTLEVSEDCISKAYLEQEIEREVLSDTEPDIHYGWNIALDKVVEIIENAPSVIPSKDDSGTARLDFVKNTIETHIDDASHGLFFTRNFAGDSMTHIDKQFGIDIEICYEYGYFEIFGLTDYEQKVIESFYDGLSAARRNK